MSKREELEVAAWMIREPGCEYGPTFGTENAAWSALTKSPPGSSLVPLYAAPQPTAEAVREECVKVCEAVEEAAHARYRGRLPGQERGTACDPHDQGRSVGAAECAAAIRAMDLSKIGMNQHDRA